MIYDIKSRHYKTLEITKFFYNNNQILISLFNCFTSLNQIYMFANYTWILNLFNMQCRFDYRRCYQLCKKLSISAVNNYTNAHNNYSFVNIWKNFISNIFSYNITMILWKILKADKIFMLYMSLLTYSLYKSCY